MTVIFFILSLDFYISIILSLGVDAFSKNDQITQTEQIEFQG